MIDPLITFVLLAAIVVVSIGAARIVSWLLDRRDLAAVRRAKEAAIVAQARAEIAALSPVDDPAYWVRLSADRLNTKGVSHGR